MTSTTKTRTALEAYMENHTAAFELVARIHEAIANHDISPDPESIGWGDVGEMAEIHSALRDAMARFIEEA